MQFKKNYIYLLIQIKIKKINLPGKIQVYQSVKSTEDKCKHYKVNEPFNLTHFWLAQLCAITATNPLAQREAGCANRCEGFSKTAIMGVFVGRPSR